MTQGALIDIQLERVRLAEDQFMQDLIEAEYDSENEDGYESEVRCKPDFLQALIVQGRVGMSMALARKDQDLRRASRSKMDTREVDVLNELMGNRTTTSERPERLVLEGLNIQSTFHPVPRLRLTL